MEDEKQSEPWPFWKKLLHFAFWVGVFYLLYLGSFELTAVVTGNG